MECLLKIVYDLLEHSILPGLPLVKLSEELSGNMTLPQRVDEMDFLSKRIQNSSPLLIYEW